jgi:hypothetical protein
MRKAVPGADKLRRRWQRLSPSEENRSVSKREKVSAVDTAWLRMDRPANLMMICGVLMLDRPLSLARLRRIVRERFLVFRRFRQRTVRNAAGAWWQDDAHFDLGAHVVAV